MSSSLPQGRVNVWQVEVTSFSTGSRIEGGEVTVTLFATQEQAVAYANGKAREYKSSQGEGDNEEEEEEGEEGEEDDGNGAEHDEATGNHRFPNEDYPEWPALETKASQAHIDFSAPSGQLFQNSVSF